MKKPKWKPTELLLELIALTFGIAFGGLIWINSFDFKKTAKTSRITGITRKVESSSDAYQISLAKFLKAKGFVLYSLDSCPYSQKQKHLFGTEAAQELLIIECSKDKLNNQISPCGNKGIRAFPAWEFNGKMNIGSKSLKELAISSGYTLIN